MAALETRLQFHDIQGNVLRPYGFPHVTFLFAQIDDAEEARRWLGELVEDVTTAEPWQHGKPAATLNVAFTYEGLAALGVPQRLLETFPPDFREGMAARATILGDVGANDPETWEEGLGTGEAHVLLRIDAQRADDLVARAAELRTGLGRFGRHVHEQLTEFLPSGRNHFGQTEGAGAVAVEGDVGPFNRGEGIPEENDAWRPVKPGEFILGYDDEDGVVAESPAEPLRMNGTYMVYRKFFMDVARFTNFTRETAVHLGGDPELVAAKILGRWRDGTPLVLSPDGPDHEIAVDPGRVDDFRYGNDPHGLRCPLGAHVRRANPRDALGWNGEMTKRHRMIRRGISYGDPPADPAVDDGVDRGLIFTCFVASLERQFEVVQAIWLNDGNVFGVGRDRDFLVGVEDPDGKMTVNGNPPTFLSPQVQFVRVRGGEYCFQPGIEAVRALARGFAD